mmetsp:Transcript_40912/g.83715  ORF Transcript_40912/g.83715 Transcript_40912/m.83715 type:complete len:272 (-) Transcript_40912:729-1544(-)
MPPKSPSQPCILISPLSTLEPTRFRTREQPKEEEEEGEDDDDEVQELREDETQNGHAFSSTTWRRASRHAAVEGYATQSLIEETVITSLFRSFQIPLQHTAIPSLSRRLGARCPGRASRGLVLQRPQLHARSDEVAVDEIDGVFDLAHVREQLRVRTRKKLLFQPLLLNPRLILLERVAQLTQVLVAAVRAAHDPPQHAVRQTFRIQLLAEVEARLDARLGALLFHFDGAGRAPDNDGRAPVRPARWVLVHPLLILVQEHLMRLKMPLCSV